MNLDTQLFSFVSSLVAILVALCSIVIAKKMGYSTIIIPFALDKLLDISKLIKEIKILELKDVNQIEKQINIIKENIFIFKIMNLDSYFMKIDDNIRGVLKDYEENKINYQVAMEKLKAISGEIIFLLTEIENCLLNILEKPIKNYIKFNIKN